MKLLTMEHASIQVCCSIVYVCVVYVCTGERVYIHVVWFLLLWLCHVVAVACHCPFQETGRVPLCTHARAFTFASPLHTLGRNCLYQLGLVCPQLVRGGEEESE